MIAAIRVIPDSRLDVETGHHPEGRYVEWFWLPTVGPTAAWLYRRLGGMLHADGCRDGFELDVAYLAASLGIIETTLVHTIDRLHRYGLLHVTAGSGVLAVRTYAPTLTERLLAKLPPEVAAVHAEIRDASFDSQRTVC